MKLVVLSCSLLVAAFVTSMAQAQVPLSAGAYTQNFDSLASSGSSNPWADNTTLPGWYASKTNGSAGNEVSLTAYSAGTGSSATGALYSYGDASSSDRALGSVCSGGTGNLAYGVRFINDTGLVQSNFVVSYTGEQWRFGNNANVQKLAFSYLVGSSLTNADVLSNFSWLPFSSLDFNSPTVGTSSASALNGNDPTNRVIFSNIILAGVAVQPGQELFLRWFDKDDSGSDHGLAIDNFTVTFASAGSAPTPPSITAQPQSATVLQGSDVSFSVSATGGGTLSYQWQFNNTNIPGATATSLLLTNVTGANAGTYVAIVTNVSGAATSSPAALTVSELQSPTNTTGLSYLTYNVNGNGQTNWSTNTAQVQAIGREITYLNPDIITFNEIPYTNTFEMTNWAKAFLAGYNIATNSGTDGFIRAVIASRYPIVRSQKYLDGVSLTNFGYSGNFSRDLFEAEIAVPNYTQHLHVFVTHLKATTSSPQNDASKRAAEAACVSNFFVTVFLPGTNGTHPYILSGDMNEDVFRPETNHYTSGHPIETMTSPSTGLRLTTPVNPITKSDLTESIRFPLDVRFDYILPCGLMYSNIVGSQILRTDLLNPLPAGLQTNDDSVASDHLPVIMYFSNPYDIPFTIASPVSANNIISLSWQTITGRQYRVESSINLTNWTPVTASITAGTTNLTFSTNASGGAQFFRIMRTP